MGKVLIYKFLFIIDAKFHSVITIYVNVEDFCFLKKMAIKESKSTRNQKIYFYTFFVSEKFS